MFSRFALFNITFNVLFSSLFLRWNAVPWVCTQIVGSVVLCEFAQRFFNSCFHFYKRELLSCDTYIVSVYVAMCSVVERMAVNRDVEKDEGQDTSLWHTVRLFSPSATFFWVSRPCGPA